MVVRNMEYKKGTFGYLNELAKNKGFDGWTEYYRYLVKKKENTLIQEEERKYQERIEKKLHKKKIIEENVNKYIKLTGIKRKRLSKLRLVDLVDSEHKND